MGEQQKTALHSKGFCGVLAEERKILLATSNNQSLGSVLDDLDPTLSLFFAKLVIMSSALKNLGGCQIRVPRSIHSINVVPYSLDSFVPFLCTATFCKKQVPLQKGPQCRAHFQKPLKH